MLAALNYTAPLLAEVEKFANLLLVGRSNDSCVVEVSLTFFRLFRQDVAVVSVFPFDLAGACEGETLFGGGIGLYFRHFAKNLVVKNYLGTWCLRSLIYKSPTHITRADARYCVNIIFF